MTDITILKAEAEDYSALKSLWKLTFHDNDLYIDRFFESLKGSFVPFAAKHGKDIVSAMYVLNLGFLKTQDKNLPCYGIYALSTLPDFRSQGIGKALLSAAGGYIKSLGGISVLTPAEASLFGYYESIGFHSFFYTAELSGTAPFKAAGGGICSVSPAHYGDVRETLLSGRAHIAFSERFLNYQNLLGKDSGGLFEGWLSQSRFIAAAEVYKDKLYIKELICENEDEPSAARLLAECLGVSAFTARTPARDKSRPFAMASVSEDWAVPPPWLGFAFD